MGPGRCLLFGLLLLPAAACATADGTYSDSGFIADEDEGCPDPEMQTDPGTDLCE